MQLPLLSQRRRPQLLGVGQPLGLDPQLVILAGLGVEAFHLGQSEAQQLSLHGWHYVIEDGEVHVFDLQRGGFIPASLADNAGTGPYRPHDPDELEDTLDGSGVPISPSGAA